jgi:two-component system, NtrC family, response regulator AtoC
MTKKLKALVVDDELVMREFMTEALEKRGFEVHSFEDPNEALDKGDFKNYVVAFIDYMLPGNINGIELIRSFRPDAPNTVVYVVTAYEKEFKNIITDPKVYPLKIKTLIPKPFTLETMNIMIDGSLEDGEG